MKIIGMIDSKLLLVAWIMGMVGVDMAYADNVQPGAENQARMSGIAGTYVDDSHASQAEAEDHDITIQEMIDSINRNTDIHENIHSVNFQGIAESYGNNMPRMHESSPVDLSRLFGLPGMTGEEIDELVERYKRARDDIKKVEISNDIDPNTYQWLMMRAFSLSESSALSVFAELTDEEIDEVIKEYRKIIQEIGARFRVVKCFTDSENVRWEYTIESESECEERKKNRDSHEHGDMNRHTMYSGFSWKPEMENLARPVYNEVQIVNFSVEAVTTALNLHFMTLERHVKRALGYFRYPDGRDSFNVFLDNYRILDLIRDEQLISSAIANDAVIIDRSIDSEGRYNWTVQIPLKVNFESSTEHLPQDILVEVIVSRVGSFPAIHREHSMNVAIAGFRLVDGSR